MKRSLLKALGLVAVVAAVAPAGAQAVGVYPAGHSFSIANGPGQATLRASLPGACPLGALTGSVPAAPNNVVAPGTGNVEMPLAAPAGASCSGGPSIAIAGSGWSLSAGMFRYMVDIKVPANGITLRWASLPGCKLVNTGAETIEGMWGNGLTAPTFAKSAYAVVGAYTGTWADDGASCALAGQTEPVSAAAAGAVNSRSVTDTTNASNVIQVIPDF